MNPSAGLPSKSRKSTYSRIADDLREEIISGRCAAGVQLPSTNELALQLSASPYTIHTALTKLVKEGWLERLNGTGTYVVDPGKRFVRAGIYHTIDICSNEHPAFVRNVHTSLLAKFKQRGKETHIFIDTRPSEQQVERLPALEKALQERSIQCLVVPSVTAISAPALQRIKIPTAFLGLPQSVPPIGSDLEDFFVKSCRHLAAQGCRSVALISTLHRSLYTEGPYFYRAFEQAMQAEGLATRREWVREPSQHVMEPDCDRYGYAEFRHLWQTEEKPDGLIIYPDVLVRGVITAILELGVPIAAPDMKFVFHRNAHIAQFCPFPVTWVVSDEEAWAEALIRVVEKQFDGEKILPVRITFSVEENVPPPR